MKNEYPRPQFVRQQWQNLNGEWQFDFDDDDKGISDKWYQGKSFSNNIQVPFVYQSSLSGIGSKEPHDIVWYKKEFRLQDFENGKRAILHFESVDYFAQVFLNGSKIGEHEGGHTPFAIDITPYLKNGTQELAVRAYDSHTDEWMPRGKQFWETGSRGIWYTNSTGIWQTVWIEIVSAAYLEQVKITPLFDAGKVAFSCTVNGKIDAYRLRYEICFQEKSICAGEIDLPENHLEWDVDLIQNHIFRTNFHDDGWAWTPESPTLFDVKFELKQEDGTAVDCVDSYFGFRKVHTEKGMVFLNNKPYYQKLVLDQGYWPEGLLTAPDDEALKKDIELAKKMGFNGCRKHQKMEEARFLYWADKLGYLVWGECASTPMYGNLAAERLAKEWIEVINRDYNHPSIVVWVPLNESWGVHAIHHDRQQQHFSQAMYHYLHALDTTRLVISNDGWEMTETDICAIHNYMHGQKDEFEKYEVYQNALATTENLVNCPSTAWDIYAKGFSYQGEPIMLTEFGGIGFDVNHESGWGYTAVSSEEDFINDYERIMQAVFASKGLWGFCYTQLTDVEQEVNGILAYDRTPKCDLSKIKKINSRYHAGRLQK